MKKIFIGMLILVSVKIVQAQDFAASLNTAKAQYQQGKLSEARFSMQQLLQKIDEKAGAEILKIYPAQLNSYASNDKGEVNGGSLGVAVNRTYQHGDKRVELVTYFNSAIIPSINTIINAANFISDPNQKVIKVAGYKALLQKNTADGGQTAFQIQIPLNSTLVSLEAKGLTEAELVAAANAVPLAAIAELLK